MNHYKFGLLILLSVTLACIAITPGTHTSLPTAVVITIAPITLPPLATETVSLSTLPVLPPAADSESEYRARARISTTADWTTLGLVDGATWYQSTLISASKEATYSGLEEHRFLLTQAIEQAEAGGKVEMIVDFFINNVESGGTLVFEIERGHLGFTEVELFNYMGAAPVRVDTILWSGINPGEKNATRFEIPAEKLMNKIP